MRNHGHSSMDIQPQGEKRRMQRRLEQLKTTMGENGAASAITAQTAKPTQEPVLTVHQQSPSMGKLILASGCSFLVGAGLMWFAVGSPQPATEPPIASHPIVAIRKPAPSASEANSVSAKTAQPAIPPPTANEQEVRELLERWRQAWVNREVDSYLGFYHPAYAPKGQSPDQWVATRRDKLASGSKISIQMREIRVHPVDAQRIDVSFLQDYASGTYKEVGRAKTIRLQHSPKGWLIVSEQQEPKRK